MHHRRSVCTTGPEAAAGDDHSDSTISAIVDNPDGGLRPSEPVYDPQTIVAAKGYGILPTEPFVPKRKARLTLSLLPLFRVR
ncbi:hypothetical protein NDU88_002505 [Pleurodeles waltl]|uniref:Uncharacterized protein n=1 Tax=Pleurodeles waltl TaxID=8319 RepID=A0AAV7RC23_PLEWA|nr:hypothetical protein NDU88_002505 [Pleurodeles waltl]